MNNTNEDLKIYWIDLFCGAGGTSSGIHLAHDNIEVIACVNHDEIAIKSHAANHPKAKHFQEDIKDFSVVLKLKTIVEDLRAKEPDCVISIWASLECTNFSKAKGGLPRDADSRTLAESMFMYLQQLQPEYFWIENVREFMSWGPLDEKGKPVSRTAGRDYLNWMANVRSHGFKSDVKLLNAANFGAYQSRERLFIQFARPNLPISWPEQTHTKDKRKNSLFEMEKWKAVREILDLQDEGTSIFDRKKDLSENTLKRILAGLVKFVAKGEPSFIKKYYSGRPEGKVISLEGPAGTVATTAGQAIVHTVNFIQQRNQGEPSSRVIDLDRPARTVTASGGNQEIVGVNYLTTYYGNGGAHSVEEPAPTVPTKDRCALKTVQFFDNQYGNSAPGSIDTAAGTVLKNPKAALVNAQYIMNQYSNGGQHTDIDSVSSAITGVPKQNLVTADQWIMNTNFNNIGKSIDEPHTTLVASRRHPYLINANSSTSPPNDIEDISPAITQRTHLLVNPSWYGHVTSVDDPSVTIIARQDKSPLYLMALENGPIAWIVFDEDSETMVAIKRFMVEWGITDIKMRMLKISELKQIQGFPKDYILLGNQTNQKKCIGNAVHVLQAQVLALNHYKSLKKYKLKIAS